MKRYQVTVDGQLFDVTVEEMTGATPGNVVPPQFSAPPPPPPPIPQQPVAPQPAPASVPTSSAAGGDVGHTVQAPMPGKILKVHVAEGDTVNSGDVLLILEAMKMENDIVAPVDGKIAKVHVRDGDSANTGDVLVVIES